MTEKELKELETKAAKNLSLQLLKEIVEMPKGTRLRIENTEEGIIFKKEKIKEE